MARLGRVVTSGLPHPVSRHGNRRELTANAACLWTKLARAPDDAPPAPMTLPCGATGPKRTRNWYGVPNGTAVRFRAQTNRSQVRHRWNPGLLKALFRIGRDSLMLPAFLGR
jgi:hypothetical protein